MVGDGYDTRRKCATDTYSALLNESLRPTSPINQLNRPLTCLSP